MARRSTLRASDSDREHVAERLRQATAEGRLLAEELEDRLGVAFSARTYGELDEVVADLPSGTVARRARPLSLVRQGALGVAMVTLMAIVALLAIVMLVWFITGMVALWMLWVAFG